MAPRGGILGGSHPTPTPPVLSRRHVGSAPGEGRRGGEALHLLQEQQALHHGDAHPRAGTCAVAAGWGLHPTAALTGRPPLCPQPPLQDGNDPDPYVKTYLLPDPQKTTKRKTKVARKTCNPTYNEMVRGMVMALGGPGGRG